MKKSENIFWSAVFFVFTIIITKVYLSKETFLYPCDLVEYNLFWRDFSELIKSDFTEFWNRMFSDVYNLNRNPFLVIPMIPFYYLIKGFRYSFITAAEFVYMIPSLFLIIKIIKDNFIKLSEKNFLTKLLVYSGVCLIPAIWLPVLKGIPDIAGMVPVLMVFILWFKYGLNRKTPIKIVLLMSFLLWVAFLFRRWYSLVIFAFFSSVIIENIIDTFILKDELKIKVKNIFYDIIKIGYCLIGILILAVIFQFKYISDLRLSDQLDIFKVDYNQWITCVNNVGRFVMFYTLLPVIFMFKKKNIRFIFLNAFIYIFTFIVLMNNQFLWINHYIFPACLICILFPVGLVFIKEKFKSKFIGEIFAIISILLCAGNYANAFFIEIPKLTDIFSQSDSKPYHNSDFKKSKEIYDYLKGEYEKNNEIKITFWGLNTSVGYHQFRSFAPDDSFARYCMPYEIVEDRDLRGDEYDADYVIILDPHGFYSDDKFIRVMLFTINEFNTGTGLAKNYELVKEADLNYNGETKLKIYKRTIPFDEKQISEYKSKLYEIRPDLREEQNLSRLKI